MQPNAVERTVVLPDGERLHARRTDALSDWILYVEGAEERVVRKRWLLAALNELLNLPRGRKPEWVREAVNEISGTDTPAGRRFPCPCCDLLTFTRPPTGTFQTCPVCAWEDDNIQFTDLDYEGGANKVSLHQARANFRSSGTSDPENRLGRPPLPEEHP